MELQFRLRGRYDTGLGSTFSSIGLVFVVISSLHLNSKLWDHSSQSFVVLSLKTKRIENSITIKMLKRGLRFQMLKINFYPDSDGTEYVRAASEYQKIWGEEGQRVIKIIEKVSGFKFKEKFINAIIFEGVSSSHPFALRASYPQDIKRARLVHELCHRIIHGNNIKIESSKPEEKSLEIHKCLDLILYDIWVELWGKEFTNRSVKWESALTPMYKQAWNWTLTLDKNKRSKKFKKFLL